MAWSLGANKRRFFGKADWLAFTWFHQFLFFFNPLLLVFSFSFTLLFFPQRKQLFFFSLFLFLLHMDDDIPLFAKWPFWAMDKGNCLVRLFFGGVGWLGCAVWLLDIYIVLVMCTWTPIAWGSAWNKREWCSFREIPFEKEDGSYHCLIESSSNMSIITLSSKTTTSSSTL